MSDKSGPSGEKRKAQGGPSAQKHKFYKFQGQNRGGRGGGGGRGRGDRGGGSRRPPRDDRPDDGKPKLNPLGKYRSNPLPDILTAPGICVTTIMNKERSAEAELINYLERIADELYPETIEGGEDVEDEGVDELDFEAQLKKDLESMDQESKSKRFQLCSHDMICVIYINVLPPLSPYKLVRHIMEQAESSARTQLKWCKRIIPIDGTTKATVKQLSELAATIVKDGFATDNDRPIKYAIDTNTRQSDRLERMSMIHTVAEQVTLLDKGHSVDLKNPEKTILLELYKNSIGMSVLEDYERFKKYNPSSIASAAAQAKGKSSNTEGLESNRSSKKPDEQDQSRTQDKEQGFTGTGNPKHVYRERRAEAIASQYTQPQAQANTAMPSGGVVAGGVENGEKDAEIGEILENPPGDIGEDWEERIVDGKVERVRKDGQ
ncbi:uncharacterized protein I303_106022 [Kwoniella dejecticola CBS 10117]|uniref:THUMP domain-containing protein n=1 Tax=Kwoniella dejecticola CBS 10117 TaxID=1296121 RepID=A0A1A6A128_9TREE|nr:uncharacterized protein I303_06042 [Kwoniella dejecticola CBS 10117]OBR83760.1 hypothetical protein I303_06042 [Kwoniella dejecticola CBS 10117]